MVAIFLTGSGLMAIPSVVGGYPGFAAVSTARGAAPGAALLAWLIVSRAQRRKGTTGPYHRAAAAALATGLVADILIGGAVGFVVFAATSTVLGFWGFRLTWTMRPLVRALEASATWQPERVR